MNHDANRERINRRTFLLLIGSLFGFIIILLRFGYLQLFNAEKFAALARRNRLRYSIVPGRRGVIYDRTGEVIVENQTVYFVFINATSINAKIEIRDKINSLLRIKGQQSLGVYKNFFPQEKKNRLIACYLSHDQICNILSDIDIMSSVEVEELSKRSYKYGEIISNITGYVTAAEKSKGGGMAKSFLQGKSGIERYYDSKIAGTVGIARSEFNAKGKKVRSLDFTEGNKGDDIQLSVSIKLQKFLTQVLGNNRGSIVVLDAKSGDILGMATSPSYDANIMSSGVEAKEWRRLLSQKGNSMMDRAICAAYPPGSIFKIVTALAIMKSGRDKSVVHCSGKYKVGNKVFRCSKRGGHGAVSMEKAIACSCNVYFYHVGQEVGIDAITDMAAHLGLGQEVGLELFGEVSGVLPTKVWREKSGIYSWYRGDTVNASIGQGYISCTPLQLAVLGATVATGRRPISRLQSGSSTTVDIPIDKANMAKLRKALRQSFVSDCGTCRGKESFYHKFGIVGKTGSAQTSSSDDVQIRASRGHSIFTGFFPYDEPRFSISVLIENGGWGSGAALNAACKVARFMSSDYVG